MASDPTIEEVRSVVFLYAHAGRSEQRNCLNARLARELLRRMEAEEHENTISQRILELISHPPAPTPALLALMKPSCNVHANCVAEGGSGCCHDAGCDEHQ